MPAGSTSAVDTNHRPVSPKNVVVAGREASEDWDVGRGGAASWSKSSARPPPWPTASRPLQGPASEASSSSGCTSRGSSKLSLNSTAAVYSKSIKDLQEN